MMVAILCLALLVSAVTFSLAFTLGLSFWSAALICWVGFCVSLILLGLAAEGANLVGTVRRSR